MDFIGDTRIDWLKYRWYFIAFSIVLATVGGLDVARQGGLSYGIDFSEGTIVYARFSQSPAIDTIRAELNAAGVGDAVIQRFDREELNSVIIRVERQPFFAARVATKTTNRIGWASQSSAPEARQPC